MLSAEDKAALYWNQAIRTSELNSAPGPMMHYDYALLRKLPDSETRTHGWET